MAPRYATFADGCGSAIGRGDKGVFNGGFERESGAQAGEVGTWTEGVHGADRSPSTQGHCCRGQGCEAFCRCSCTCRRQPTGRACRTGGSAAEEDLYRCLLFSFSISKSKIRKS